MERAILGILGIVALVAVIGVLFAHYNIISGTDALGGGNGVTGGVVATDNTEPAVQTCGSCSGYSPVCAKVNNIYKTYPNACEAKCAGATVAASTACQSIAKN